MKVFPKQPMSVPNILAFRKILERFKSHAQQSQAKLHLQRKRYKEKNFFENQPGAHIRNAVDALKFSYGIICRILRKQLKWKA